MRVLFIAAAMLLSGCAAAADLQSVPDPKSQSYGFSGLTADEVAHFGLLLGREQSEAAARFNASKALSDKMQKQITDQDKAREERQNKQ